MKVLIQSISFMLLIISVTTILLHRKRFGRLPRGGVNLLSLSIHLIIFYSFVLLASTGVFDLLGFLNNILGVDYLTYHLWSSAIRLQTIIEMFMMASLITGGGRWTGVL